MGTGLSPDTNLKGSALAVYCAWLNMKQLQLHSGTNEVQLRNPRWNFKYYIAETRVLFT